MTRKSGDKPAGDPDISRTYRSVVMPGETQAGMLARVAASGMLENAATLQLYGKGTIGQIDITEAVHALLKRGREISQGDFSEAEAMLAAQASSLNAIFAEMARRAAMNMGEHLGATETYLRLALKAQSQCRATVETLATIKAGPVVIARQANIAHGPQQVNNGNAPGCSDARAGNSDPVTNELLGVSDGERLDSGTPDTASGSNPALEALGTVHRPAK